MVKGMGGGGWGVVGGGGRTHQEVSTKVRQQGQSLSERRYFVRQRPRDLLYANAKDLIQSRRIRLE